MRDSGNEMSNPSIQQLSNNAVVVVGGLERPHARTEEARAIVASTSSSSSSSSSSMVTATVTGSEVFLSLAFPFAYVLTAFLGSAGYLVSIWAILFPVIAQRIVENRRDDHDADDVGDDSLGQCHRKQDSRHLFRNQSSSSQSSLASSSCSSRSETDPSARVRPRTLTRPCLLSSLSLSEAYPDPSRRSSSSGSGSAAFMERRHTIHEPMPSSSSSSSSPSSSRLRRQSYPSNQTTPSGLQQHHDLGRLIESSEEEDEDFTLLSVSGQFSSSSSVPIIRLDTSTSSNSSDSTSPLYSSSIPNSNPRSSRTHAAVGGAGIVASKVRWSDWSDDYPSSAAGTPLTEDGPLASGSGSGSGSGSEGKSPKKGSGAVAKGKGRLAKRICPNGGRPKTSPASASIFGEAVPMIPPKPKTVRRRGSWSDGGKLSDRERTAAEVTTTTTGRGGTAGEQRGPLEEYHEGHAGLLAKLLHHHHRKQEKEKEKERDRERERERERDVVDLGDRRKSV